MITAKTKVCMVIGDPIAHSLSPEMHNAGYQALGIAGEFVYVAANVKIENIKQAVNGFRSLGIRGISCTMPHKLEVMRYLDEIDPVAEKIGAVNTIVNDKGKLTGYNTDWLGIITPLEEKTNIAGKKVVILGAGGAARAMAYGLTQKRADVTILNRTVANAKTLAKEFLCNFGSIHDIETIKQADIILNATSVGMGEMRNESPIPGELINKNMIIFDAIYHPYETKLLQFAKNNGAQTIHGLAMLLHQGTAQFELYTKHKAPVETMRKVLMRYTSKPK